MTRPDPVERYLASIRRSRIVYSAVVTALLAAVGITVAVAYSRGEANNTELHTVERAPASVPLAAASAHQALAWRTTDRPAIGTPVDAGTVVTWSAHTVRGRNARTGRTTWSYLRSDRTVCTAAQIDGVTIAVYEVSGNCDEVTALDSGTGVRLWTRTLDEDAQPIFGHPTYQATSLAFLVVTPSVIYAINPASNDSGQDLWTYSRYGCSITGAVLGSIGALISQDCTHPNCGTIKFCHAGPQLFLRNGTAERTDPSKPNFDQITWNDVGSRDVPTSADQILSAVDPATHVLDMFDSVAGKPAGTIRLSPPLATVVATTLPRVPAVADAADGEVIRLDGTTYAVGVGGSASIWGVRTSALPTLIATSGDVVPNIESARMTVPTTDGVATIDGATGHTVAAYALSVPTGSTVAYPLGTGFVVGGASGTVVSR